MFQECRHIKSNGSKCHAAAMKGKPYCYYHVRLHGLARRSAAPATPYEQKELVMPFLEDRGAVQVALSEIVSAIAARRIDSKSAGLIIYALQVASSNAKDIGAIVAEDQVRDCFETEEGEELGEEVTAYDPGDEEYRDEYGEQSLTQLILGTLNRSCESPNHPAELNQTEEPEMPEKLENTARHDEQALETYPDVDLHDLVWDPKSFSFRPLQLSPLE